MQPPKTKAERRRERLGRGPAAMRNPVAAGLADPANKPKAIPARKRRDVPRKPKHPLQHED